MPALLLGIALLAGCLLLAWGFSRADARQVASVLKVATIVVVVLLGLYLLLVGRYAIAAALPVLGALALRLAPGLLARHLSGRGPARTAGTPGRSSVRTRFLSMTLDHVSGETAGEVLTGRFQGRSLDDLDLGELLALRDEVLADGQSLALLEAWLDRRHPDWREPAQDAGARPAARGEDMTREEAYAILGLATGAGPQEIKEAHRRLMQKLHPDRGGSDWLAAKLNRAKDVLLSG